MSDLTPENLNCKTCQYYYRDKMRGGELCNAFHSDLNPVMCGDYLKITKPPSFREAMETLDDLMVRVIGLPASAMPFGREPMPNCRSMGLDLNLRDSFPIVGDYNRRPVTEIEDLSPARRWMDAKVEQYTDEMIQHALGMENRERDLIDRLREETGNLTRDEYEATPVRRKVNVPITPAILESCQAQLDRPGDYQIGYQVTLRVRVMPSHAVSAIAFLGESPNRTIRYDDLEITFTCDWHPSRYGERAWVYNGPIVMSNG